MLCSDETQFEHQGCLVYMQCICGCVSIGRVKKSCGEPSVMSLHFEHYNTRIKCC